MKSNMQSAIRKLNNIVIYPQLTYIFYNTYLIKSIYFGIDIIKLSLLQEKELMKIYEPTILRKLGLSQKFLRRVLYTRKTAMGVEITKSLTIVDTLLLKLYIGYK